MKKVILVTAVLFAGIAATAQDEIIIKRSSSGTYNAFSIPPTIRMDYQAIYGDPNTVDWEYMDKDEFFVTHLGSNNRLMRIYYPTDPWYLVDVPDRDFSYQVALPVMNTWIPEEVVTKAISKHGNSLYSITKLKTTDGKETYQIGVLANGAMTTHMME